MRRSSAKKALYCPTDLNLSVGYHWIRITCLVEKSRAAFAGGVKRDDRSIANTELTTHRAGSDRREIVGCLRGAPLMDDDDSLVTTIVAEIAALTVAMATPQPDADMNRVVDTLFAATIRLAHAPAMTPVDLDRKFAVLCRRLNESLDPDDRGAVLTVLLASALRDEAALLLRDRVRPNAA